MEELQRTTRTTLKRRPQRGSHDREAVNAILDRSLVCHVGFVADGAPRVLPTLHARIDDRLFIHGAVSNRMLRTASGEDAEICVTATLIDGLVMARSAFHHSVNYRSAVIFGRAREVTDRAEKMAAMRALVEHVAPGRWDGTRHPTNEELDGTTILELPIDEASAKVRTGGPIDDEADLALPHWAGVIPLRTEARAAIPDEKLADTIRMPAHINEYRAPDARYRGWAQDGAPFESTTGDFTISTDTSRLDLGVIHSFLETSYWASKVPRAVVARSIANSLCFGIYAGTTQVGFARVVTDYATFANLMDVFVVPEYRGRGLSKALMAAVTAHPHLQGLRRWTLGTRDAHELYRRFGFNPPKHPERMMERGHDDIYRHPAPGK